MKMNWNKIEQLGRQEGLKNSDDIFDVAAWDNIYAEVTREPLNIREHLHPEMSLEQAEVLKDIRDFATETSAAYKQAFLDMITSYQEQKRRLSPAIMRYLEEKNLLLPSFVIADSLNADSPLKEWGFEGYSVNPENFLVNFQLPKPLAQFWWKGQAEWNEKKADWEPIERTVIEWGDFYHRLMPVVYEKQGEFENERDLNFLRINDRGQHDPKAYYYLWEIAKWRPTTSPAKI